MNRSIARALARGKEAGTDPVVVNAALGAAQALTVEAWIEAPCYRAEALQAVVSQWRITESFDRFDACDASTTDGLSTRGFFGAVFDGRYVYFVPQHDGVGRHGKVLRYDTHAPFKDASSWSGYDAGRTSGLNCKGYYGAVFDGRYVFFTPRTDDAGYHTRLLRYDTHSGFADPSSWSAHDLGPDTSYQGAAFDGRFLYACPGYDRNSATLSGTVLRFDTLGDLSDPSSAQFHDASGTGGFNTRCYDGAVYDGRCVYFAPLDAIGQMLRYDTQGGFTDRAAWQAFDARSVDGLAMGKCVGATFDGRYVYYVPYANSVVVRFDTRGAFGDPSAWSAYEARRTSGLDVKGYDGAVFDGRFVTFIPFWEGGDARSGFHGRVLRYDATRGFTDSSAWAATDAGHTDGMLTAGFNAGAFDGRFIYFAPWRSGTREDGSFVVQGNVLRYDTTGAEACFSLRCMEFGHNGGLCGALPGPSFLVNTGAGVRNARANRALGPGRHYLAGTYDGRRIRLYVDGLVVADQPARGTLQACSQPVVIGGLQDGLGRFEGAIRNVRLSPIARTSDWIAAQYRAGTPKAQ